MPTTSPVPKFCPNPQCQFFDPAKAYDTVWYVRHGTYNTKCRGDILRFRCRCCGHTCSSQTYSIHYWTHRTIDLKWLFQHLYSGSGLRQIGRFAGVTYRVVQNRIRRLARNSLWLMSETLENLDMNEDVAMDGFESFAGSQYFPNNITFLVGCSSQFIYGAVHTTFRRRGSMTSRQRETRERLDAIWRPPAHALLNDCSRLLSDAAPLFTRRCSGQKTAYLYSDEHKTYVQALGGVPELKRFMDTNQLIHTRISSRRARTVANPLFPVNYVDRQIRKNMGEHVRETVKHGREVNCQMERLSIFMAAHNFATPHRIADRADAENELRHAEKAGVPTELVHEIGRDFVSTRHLWNQMKVKRGWMESIWKHRYSNPPSVSNCRENAPKDSKDRRDSRVNLLPGHLLA